MTREHGRRHGALGDHAVVHFDGDGVVHVRGRDIRGVHAQLVGGRTRYSVGGAVKEGPRWWRGLLEWPGDDAEPLIGTEVIIELDNGRRAAAVVEPDPTAPAHTAVVHGVDPPPFDVP
jgi:hypothetical protein